MADSSVLGRGTAEGVINLGKGHPATRLLPLEELKNAFVRATMRPNAAVNMLQYGNGEGNQDAVDAVRSEFEPDAAPGSILITNGSSQALDSVCLMFSSPGDTIYADSPAYFLAFFTFKDHGLKVVDIPTDEFGIDTEQLRIKLQSSSPDDRPKLLYTVPFCNNPTGISMTEQRIKELVSLAQEYNFKVVVDEVYRFLTFPADSAPPKSVRSFDNDSCPCVIALNSFSKLLGPGLRLGWMTAHPSLIQKLVESGLILSGGGLNPVTSEAIAELIRTGEQRKIITNLRKVYESKMNAMSDAVDRYIIADVCPQAVYYKPTGGFFFWLRFPDGLLDTWQLNEIAQLKHGVSFFPGAKFSSSGRKTPLDNCLRMCFAFLESDELEEGVRRLSCAIKQVLESKQ
mmetsp:Transcript_8410/g.15218  ORF Transcript_8410/g.15218 Transcript_8410/m.15218 type:complete len:400 (-) Transcript_8410:824-2023(-)|eukprot:CAMPEP_0182447904 /NCGR_PEP_ID=MMETSP1172-20130603/21575_1 /TAXON_ID=708627 /ORGANISM="Timspurckia oligopyrenoides, Strain CCMP3278" /LENGTH=399 /DNA_ID=CAMNT_0024644545 /DNA_START=78 /DNA_END=1277 /DNA_ORIENTATION=-